MFHGIISGGNLIKVSIIALMIKANVCVETMRH
jgi:hypothetical protein